MGVELHGMSHDVGHLIVASVVEQLHRVEYASLHGFESVTQVGNGALEDYVRGVVQKPVLVHTRKL